MSAPLTHLQQLEAESIQIIREVVAEFENPVMLYSIGKDSAVMLHLARKAFYPAPPPFPLLHVDTTWKFREMISFRDRMAAQCGFDLIVHVNQEGVRQGVSPFSHGSALYTDVMKTEGLKQALDKYKFDAAFGGARRDEEKSRAKERIFSFRSAHHRWDPKNQRPELWDSKLVFEDQLAALEADSRKVGTQGGAIDYALLLDGLQAEREQGITIDVAYRFFSTDKRKFIVADTPGHEQYTRNMVTGASTAQVAVILVDARKGLLTQTRRHSYLVSLVGIRHIVLAVNKMDLVAFDRQRFDTIRRDYEQFAVPLGFASITAIPISALGGDNIIEPSDNTPWYTGPTLLRHLETVRVEDDSLRQPFRLPVQWVNRPHLDFRGFCGTIAAGSVRPGDEIQVAASGRCSRVARIVTMNGDLQEAVAGQAITLTMEDEIDVSRGDMLTAPDLPPLHTRHLQAHLVWLHDEPLQTGKSYLIKTATVTIPGRVTSLQHAMDINTLEQRPAETLELNGIGVGLLELDRPATVDSYRQNRHTGSFIIIDRFTNATIAAGMVIAAAPELSETTTANRVDSNGIRRINLGDAFVSSDEGNLVDLTAEEGPVEFDVTPLLLQSLARGNRVLLLLGDPGQLTPLAQLTFEHHLQFTVSRDGDRLSLVLFGGVPASPENPASDDPGL